MKAQLTLVSALALGALLACTSIAGAADAKAEKKGERKGGASVEQRVDHMATNLNLTAEQKTKVKDLFEKQGKEMREMRDQNPNMTPEQRREKMAESRKAMDAKMKEILKPDQYEKWLKNRQNRPERPGAAADEHKTKGKKNKE